MVKLPPAARALIESGRLAHFATLGRDGSPHLTVVWVGLDDDEIVMGHLNRHQKIRNIERDDRVALSLEGDETNEWGLREHLVIEGRARVVVGGGAALLSRLARVYLGPDVVFPKMPHPPDGWVIRVMPERWRGVGPWVD